MKSPRIRRRNIQSFCRTCLAEIAKHSLGKGQKYNVHKTEDLANWIKICTQLQVERNNDYPNYLCQECYNKLQSFFEFRLTCIRSMHFLDGVLGKNENAAQIENEAPKEIMTKKELCEDEIQKVGETSDWLSFDSKNNIGMDNKQEDTLNEQFLVEAKLENPEVTIDIQIKKGFEDDENKETTQALLENEESFEYKNCSGDANSLNVTEFLETVNYCSEEAIEKNSVVDSESGAESILKEIKPKRNRTRRSVKKQTGYDTDCVKKPAKRFVCEICQRRCISEENLAAHLRIHKGLRPHPCNQCERAFNRVSRLKAHIRETHRNDIEMIKCSFAGCDKAFKREDTVRMHYRLKHSGIQKPILKRTYMCEDCGRTFKNVTTLKEHRYRHRPAEEYPYQCDICEKRYTSQRTFKEHKMRHAGIKNYVCPYCGMRKTTRNELRIHVNYHTKEKQWPCPSCKSVFNNSANLGLHTRVVHKGIRAYACRYCEQSFGKAETLKHHEMRHTGEKPHECQTCGKRFIQAVALRAHLKTHNKLEVSDAKLVSKQQQSLSEDEGLATTSHT